MGSINFKLNGGGNIQTVNIRKVKRGDNDNILAVDIKIQGETHGAILCDLLGVGSPGEVSSFWRPNVDNDAAFNGISRIQCWAEYSDHKLKLSRKTFNNTMLTKFEVKPTAHMLAQVTFTATIEDISEADLELVATSLKRNVACADIGPKDMFEVGVDTETDGDEQE